RVVKEIEAKIQEAPRNRPSFKGDVALGEVEPARAHQEHGGLLMETVLLARGRIVEGEPSANRVAEVELPFDEVIPGRGIRVLEIRHEEIGARVERVDRERPRWGCVPNCHVDILTSKQRINNKYL